MVKGPPGEVTVTLAVLVDEPDALVAFSV